MASRVQWKGSVGSSGAYSITFPSPITVGNKIVVLVYAPNNAITVSDNLGNSYAQASRVDNVWGLYEGGIYYADVAFGGSCTVTITNVPISFHSSAIIAEYTGLGTNVHGAIGIGNYVPGSPLPGPNRTAIISGAVPTSDTFIITMRGCGGNTVTLQSDTGDTLVGSDPGFRVSLWERSVSVAGNAIVEIQSTSDIDNSSTMAVVAFSAPLAEPPGLTKQFALQPGWGMFGGLFVPPPEDGSYNTGAENTFSTMKIVRCSFPYPVKIGSLLIIAALQNFTNDDVPFVVSDLYGNSYSLLGSQLRGTDPACVAVYSCRVTAIPAAGTPFEVILTMTSYSGHAGTYAHPGLAIVELRNAPLASLSAAFFRSATAVGPNYRMITDPLSVAKNTILVGFAAADPLTGESVAWTADASYTLRSTWSLAQGSPTVNRPRMATMALMDKVAPADGSFDAEVLVNSNSVNGMALVAITVLGGPPCDAGTSAPSTDNQFELTRVVATMKPATHLPIRGRST